MTRSNHRPSDPLARVCGLLNEEDARYIVVGGQACILHGLVRTTEDVDILIDESEENYRNVITALSRLHWNPSVADHRSVTDTVKPTPPGKGEKGATPVTP